MVSRNMNFPCWCAVDGRRLPEKAAEIERLTRGQSKCQRWFDEKKWRVTASKFGDVCKSGPDQDFNLLASQIYDPQDISKVATTSSNNSVIRYRVFASFKYILLSQNIL